MGRGAPVLSRHLFTCWWADGIGIALHTAQPQRLGDPELDWVFDLLRKAYGL